MHREGREPGGPRVDHPGVGPPPAEAGTGAASAYKVQRARSGKDKWTPAGTAVHTTIVLKDQERGVEWQYRVIAVNRAGEGMESNVMTAVL